MLFAVAVGVFAYHTIEHPAHDVKTDPAPGSDAYLEKLAKEEREREQEAKE